MRVLFTVLAFLLLLGPSAVQAFEVRGVKVAISAPDAIKARDAAFAAAQERALETVAKQLLTTEELKEFKKPSASRLSSFVQDFEIIKEKAAANKYAGLFNIRFKDSAVRSYFGEMGVSNLPSAFPDFENGIPMEKAKSVAVNTGADGVAILQAVDNEIKADYLILPFLDDGLVMRLWEDPNPWREAWKQAADEKPIKTLVVPLGDLNDMRDFQNVRSIEQIFASHWQPLLLRYAAREAVIVVARVEDTDKMVISIFRADGAKPVYARELAVSRQGQTETEFLADAVATTQKILLRNWKPDGGTVSSNIMPANDNVVMTATSPVIALSGDASQAGQSFKTLIRFRSLTEWLAIQQTLYTIPSLQQLKIMGLRSNEADVRLTATVDMAALQGQMAAKGYRLLPQGAGDAYILLAQ